MITAVDNTIRAHFECDHRAGSARADQTTACALPAVYRLLELRLRSLS